ncbi:hypothetical protein H5410_009244 [Solanum commersonii]|uniref:Uncharacterized protein n=1 Tax=Solanum commersonii TaxID=4109 RepID=A0A9J6AIZ0_SOLCO|nr:hypothetical protein H5410_009244 [Solanum commersonii]
MLINAWKACSNYLKFEVDNLTFFGNKLADVLETQGSNLPTPAVLQKLEADKEGVPVKKWVSITTNGNLSKLGNLSVIYSAVSNQSPSGDSIASEPYIPDGTI